MGGNLRWPSGYNLALVNLYGSDLYFVSEVDGGLDLINGVETNDDAIVNQFIPVHKQKLSTWIPIHSPYLLLCY
jgi:hypothetical protein